MSIHLFIVHFPVALVVLAAFLDLLGIASDNPSLQLWAWRMLLGGAVAGLFAFATGEGARLAAFGAGGIDLSRLEIHEQWGGAGIWGIALAALLRSLWRNRTTPLYRWLNLALLVGAAGLVVAITISGTLVRHG